MKAFGRWLAKINFEITGSKNTIWNRLKIQYKWMCQKFSQNQNYYILGKDLLYIYVRKVLSLVPTNFKNHSIRPAEEVFSREANEHNLCQGWAQFQKFVKTLDGQFGSNCQVSTYWYLVQSSIANHSTTYLRNLT